MSILRKAVGAAALLIALAAPAMAADSVITVIMGGEAYDGPPKFEVSFGGKVIGHATVEAAIDTATDGRFAAAADKGRYVQSFFFAVPEALFDPEGEVRLRLTNEAFGGEGSDRDRNLFLASVAVNGRAVTLSGLSTLGPDGPRPNQTVGEFLMLRDGNEQGASPAPGGGWPAAETDVPNVEAVEAQKPVEGLKPLTAANAPAAQTGTVAERPECSTDELYNVIGFNENSNDLTPRLMERLDQIVAALKGQRCTATITGYSSTQGDYATNALFSVERAQNVLRYLRQQGVAFSEATATGVGETTQFGPELNANRRVVIAVRP